MIYIYIYIYIYIKLMFVHSDHIATIDISLARVLDMSKSGIRHLAVLLLVMDSYPG